MWIPPPRFMLLALLLLGSPAHAVSLSPHGLGQVLIYPYYTVNKGQDTLLSLVNTGDVGKVANVTFAEGYNSRNVLRFDVLLSPHDVWSAAISQTSDTGVAKLTTADHSCTYPPFAGAVSLGTFEFDGSGGVPPDSGPQTAVRTREGFIQVIARGDVVPGSPTDVRITHAQTGSPQAGSPPGCAEISNTNVDADLVASSGGLFGSASIVNVGEGTFFSYDATALAGFSDQILGLSDGGPRTLQDAHSAQATSGGATANIVLDDGSSLALDYLQGIDAVSAVLMADAIQNEYLVGAGLGANTDWVLTFPTKAFYTDVLYDGDAPHAPFPNRFSEGVANVAVITSVFDREEGQATPAGTTPPPLVPHILSAAVNVVSFQGQEQAGAPSNVLGSVLTTRIAPYGDAGWASFDLSNGDGGHALASANSTVVLHGLPTIGFMVYNIVNANAAPGRLANYGGAFAHRSTVACTSATPVRGGPCS